MKIVFLGTNGWYTTPTGNTACILIDSKDHYVIFDAGNGLYQIDQYIKKDKPISLFISHFHLDHVNGLHTLAKFHFSQGIDVFVGAGRKKDFETLVHPPYTIGYIPQPQNIGQLRTQIRLHELVEGEHTVPFPILCKQLYHAYTDHGYRIELEGKTIAYSGDTGVGPHSYTLFQGVDMLIHECSLIAPQSEDTWGHTDPFATAKLAKEAGVKQLILTHFGANQYTDLSMRDAAAKKAKKIFRHTLAAKDGMIVTL